MQQWKRQKRCGKKHDDDKGGKVQKLKINVE